MLNNFVSQAGTMGNDPSLEIPVRADFVTRTPRYSKRRTWEYRRAHHHHFHPGTERLVISHPPIARITVGFIIAGLAMVYAAGVQHLIYISVSSKNTLPTPFQQANIDLPATLL
jgi:POT family proton-dependent oligopeptide transporter